MLNKDNDNDIDNIIDIKSIVILNLNILIIEQLSSKNIA